MEHPKLIEKYERNGWPSLKRTDLKPPVGLNLSLLTSLERIRSHSLSSQGQIACIKDGETLSDVFTMSANGSWLSRVTTDRPLAAFWDDEIPEWSPSGRQMLVVVNKNGSFELMLVETESGSISELRSEVGLHSNPNWAKDESYITFEFESPTLPPDLYRMDLKNKQATQLTFSDPPAMQKHKFIAPEIVSYKSYDGLEIPAFLYRPEKSNGAAILYPHGGPKDQYGLAWDEIAQYFVAKGYTYLAPNYRGSTGYGKDFERANYNDWGVGDTQDCLHGAKYLKTLKGIKPDRIGIAGGSYGGYMTINALSRDPEYLFACGIAKYGDANLVSSWAQCEKRLRLYTEVFLGHPSENLGVYLKDSPITEAKNIQKPVLILHGLLDTVVPPEASEEWVEALRHEGKTFEYKTYDDEPHGFLRRENLIDVYARMERFLDWYLLPK